MNIVACHLGAGSSIACIRGGISIDTSMGLTPLEGCAPMPPFHAVNGIRAPFVMHSMYVSTADCLNIRVHVLPGW